MGLHNLNNKPLTPINISTNIQTIQSFWEAFRSPICLQNLTSAENLFKKIQKDGWAFESDVKELLYYLDPRIEGHLLNVHGLSDMFGIVWEPIVYKPQRSSNFSPAYDGIRLEYMVIFLIYLERLGFNTNAAHFVNLVLPEILSHKKRLLSIADLEMFWYFKTQHKYEPIYIGASDKIIFDEWNKTSEYKNEQGYKLKWHAIDESDVGVLAILSPKFMKRKKPVPTACKECGILYLHGDPGSSLKHRKLHKSIMAYLDPKPSDVFLKARLAESEPELVTAESKLWKHKEMYKRASAFKKEMGFDLTQWQNGREYDPNVHGFLFGNDDGAIVGACAFRWRRKNKWGLQWVWICPKERRNGHLTKRWSGFRGRFGDFTVEFPVSESMQAFLHKQGDSHLME